MSPASEKLHPHHPDRDDGPPAGSVNYAAFSDGRVPPNNVELEQSLLGGMMVKNHLFDAVSRELRAEHFYGVAHATIFAAIADLRSRGVPANPITLRTHLRGDEDLQRLGGQDYLVRLCAATFTVMASEAEALARELVGLSGRRALIAAADQMREQAFSAATPLLDTLRGVEIAVGEVRADAMGSRGGLKPISVAFDEAVDLAQAAYRHGGVIGRSTGIKTYDRITGGLAKQDFIVLAGRPSMGKTSVLVTWAYNVARQCAVDAPAGEPLPAVLLFSQEMGQAQLAAKILAYKVNRSWNLYRTGKAKKDDMDALFAARIAEQGLPIYVDESPAQSPADLAAKVQRMANQRPIALMGVDYIQLMKGDVRSRDGNRVQEISQITAALKGLAKTHDAPMVGLSQLSREVEKREDKRPQLADLRDSGSIEQDADAVVFVFRPEYYLERSEPKDNDKKWSEWRTRMDNSRGVAELIVEKQRVGPIGTARCRFTPDTQWFDDFPDAAISEPGGPQLQGDLLQDEDAATATAAAAYAQHEPE